MIDASKKMFESKRSRYPTNVTELNQILKFVDVDTILLDTSILWVHDTKNHVTYKANLDILEKAIAKKLQYDGLLPIQGD